MEKHVMNQLYKKNELININTKTPIVEKPPTSTIDQAIPVSNPQAERDLLNKLNSDKMYSNIKDIFVNNPGIKIKQNFFTSKKAKTNFNIDKSIFSPTPMVSLSGKNFRDKYLLQLEGFIFTEKENLSTDELFSLIYLVETIEKKHYPITIVTGKYKTLLPKIVSSLNEYFNDNYPVLKSIYRMFQDAPTQTKEVENGQS